MTFEFKSEAEKAVGMQMGYVIRPSVSEAWPGGDRIDLRWGPGGPKPVRTVPVTQQFLTLFEWTVKLEAAYVKAKAELTEFGLRQGAAQAAALRAVAEAASGPVEPA